MFCGAIYWRENLRCFLCGRRSSDMQLLPFHGPVIPPSLALESAAVSALLMLVSLASCLPCYLRCVVGWVSCPIWSFNYVATGASCIQFFADLLHPSRIFVPHVVPLLRRQWRGMHAVPRWSWRTPPTFSCLIGSPYKVASGAAYMQFRADLAHPSHVFAP